MLLTAESHVVKASLAASLMSSVCLTRFLLLPVAIPVTRAIKLKRTAIFLLYNVTTVCCFSFWAVFVTVRPPQRLPVQCVRHVLCVRMYRMRLFSPGHAPFILRLLV